MIKPTPEKSRSIRKIERKDDCLFLYAEKGIHRLKPMSEHSVRITYTEKEAFSTRVKPGLTAKGTFSSWEYQADEHQIILTSGLIRIVINRHTASYTYTDEKGRLLLQEKDRDSKILDPFVSYKLAAEEEIRTEQVQTADGMKEVIREAVRVPDETLYHTRLNLTWQAQEALYGLGQQEEGLLNLRGHMVFVHQTNRKIAIPMLVSSLGYGLLMDTYSPMIF